MPTVTPAGYNERKLEILRLFAAEGPSAPRDIAAWTGLYPIRAVYTRLLELHRFGLLYRTRRAGRLVYSLSPKGAARIAWLEARLPRQSKPTAPPPIPREA
jgi:DNA-binding IclR family transcriptional regulator